MPDEIKELEKKICKHCNEEKLTSEYNKAGGNSLQPYCKPCDAERKRTYTKENIHEVKRKRKEYYEENKERISVTSKEKNWNNNERAIKYRKEYYDRNREIKREKDREYRKKYGHIVDAKQKLRRQANPEHFKKKAKEMRDRYTEEDKKKMSEYNKQYRLKNKEKLDKYNENNKEKRREYRRLYCRKKNAEDIAYKIVKNLRTRIRFALKRDGAIKSDTTANLLGCPIQDFVSHFKSLFTEGMTWERFMKGEIQIDHVKPCAEFDLTKEDQQRECFNYKNLQPLWQLDNLKKGAKYE